MPWILLGIVVILVQISVWGGFTGYRSSLAPSAADYEVTFQSGVTHPDGGYIELNVGCDDTLIKVFPQDALSRLSDKDRARLDQDIDWELRRCAGLSVMASVRQEARERFVLPTSVSNALGVGFNFGAVLIMILTASVIGSEYGWGTLRMTLAKGTGRWQLLTSKMILLLLVGSGGFIIMGLTAAFSSLAAASLAPEDGGGACGLRPMVHSGGDVRQGCIRADSIRHLGFVLICADLIVKHGNRHLPVVLLHRVDSRGDPGWHV